MKKRTFLKHLENHNGQFKLQGDEIRTKKEYEVTGSNEITYKKHLCPIEVLTLKDDIAFEDVSAAQELKIEDNLRDIIMEAADYSPDSLSFEAINLRKSMLRVLGLKEKKQ